MRVYADSSFIVSIYTRELHTPRALLQTAELQAAGNPILLSELAHLEMSNALQLAVFRGSLAPAKARELLTVFGGNIEAGAFQKVQSPHSVWQAARQLSHAQVATLGCRSLDVLQVASALLFNAELFLTFDQRQRALALAAGLNAPDLLH